MAVATGTADPEPSSSLRESSHPPHEARLYERRSGGRVRCHLCAHHCSVPDGRHGICHVRQNIGGTLYTLVYGHAIAQDLEPIEKKPLFHFHPGSTAYSIATVGCDFRCQWCQNWEISQRPLGARIRSSETSPQELVRDARGHGSHSIAYTYTEPTVFFEYAFDTAVRTHAAGMANVFVTNGYMTGEMLSAFRPYLDAANVDLKAFRDATYRRYVGARLQPVLDALEAMRRFGVWLEVTTLVIPGVNDSREELRDVTAFIVRQLGPDTPWHVSRFFPAYRMTDRPPTPLKTLWRAREIGREAGLRYVYIGNVAEEGSQVTACPGCHRVLIRRPGFGEITNYVRELCCPDCGTRVAGVGMNG